MVETKKMEWNLSPLLSGDNDASIDTKNKQVQEAADVFVNKWKDRSDYLQKPEVLKQALDEYEKWQSEYGSSGDVGYYFNLRSYQDKNNDVVKAKSNKIDELSKKIRNEVRFFEHKISKIPKNEQKTFLDYKELREYKHFLELLFTSADYLLSEAEEKIMSLKRGPSYDNWVEMVESFLYKEERELADEKSVKKKRSFSEIEDLMKNKKKEVRDAASKAMMDILEKHRDAAENELNSILMDKKINDDLRKMNRPDLARHIEDDIDSQAVDTLLEAVTKRYDISHRYYKLKAALQGVKKLKYYERTLPYGKIDQQYTYDETVALVNKVFGQLDKEFSDIFMNTFVKNNQIDVYPRKGKQGGAFCIHLLKKQPTYLLLNFSGKLRDIETLAHEAGHGINAELMKQHQNSLNVGTPKSTAEVASTFMEDFVGQELEKKADEETRLALMINKMDGYVSTIIRQVACYKFEQELHNEYRKKGHLPKKEIGEIFRKNMEAYMGPFVDQKDGGEDFWIKWPHIREYFYVYSYASGLLISKSLQNSVRKDPSFVKKVKEFLCAGTSDSPKNIFLKLGIDITKKEFWEKGLNEIDSLLKETEQLAKKLKKI